jgi:hypothetical protein
MFPSWREKLDSKCRVLGCEGFARFSGFFDFVTKACLRSTVTVWADFAVLFFLLVFVNSLRVGGSVTWPRVGMGSGSGPGTSAPRPLGRSGSNQVPDFLAVRTAPKNSTTLRQECWVHGHLTAMIAPFHFTQPRILAV